MLVDIFIYIGKEYEHETIKLYVEFHLFIHDIRHFFADRATVFKYWRNISLVFCAIHHVAVRDMIPF